MKLNIRSCALWAALSGIQGAAGFKSYDTWMDADLPQSGYLPTHNMDPAVVDSAQFGQLWKVGFNANEQFFAKPLVVTPSGSSDQIVFLASSQNWIRTLNAKTGALINSRQVNPPFLQSDLNGCGDIANTIGIIGTPFIDPATEIAYFFSKTYKPNFRTSGNTGILNGIYNFHGVNLQTLQDVPGYPILVDGTQADNDPLQTFIGGIILQRPSLTKVGNVVYGGFGGHCDKFNYTGVIVGVDVVDKKIVANWATMSGPLTPHLGNATTNGDGGEGGVWQSGFGISSDGNRLFIVTGNGNAHENNGVPANGRGGCRTLGESIINLGINPNGSLFSQDYFQPYDYQNMDAGDQDFGSSGLCLLDPTVFKGTGVNRIGVTAGKNGKIYIANVDNLGGYKMGSGGSDLILQSIQTNKAVFGGAGSYPLEGGYFYITPVGYPTYAYKLSPDSAGKPQFAYAGATNETSAGRVGIGIPVVTSLNGRPGTAIMWMTDPNAGIRAWYAVPGSNGVLKTIKMPQIGGANKFQRPTFGDTRLYTSDGNGNVYCLGSPVNLPLNCSTPVDFGDVAIGSVSTAKVNCTAVIDITSLNGATTGDARFSVDNSTLPKGAIKKGTSFSFPVTWNLTTSTISNTANASYGQVSPGIKTTPLTLLTTNSVGGYATVFPISLIGNEVSKMPFLQTAPTSVDFGGVVLRPDEDVEPLKLTWTIKNAGLMPMNITGYSYTSGSDDDDDGPAGSYTNATKNNGVWDMGDSFSSTDLPNLGTVISPGQSIGVTITFNPDDGVGQYFSLFSVFSNGGTTSTIVEGSASTAPIANMSLSTSEGGWLDVTKDLNPTLNFGVIESGANTTRQIRICNEGGSVLAISKSKPPTGIFYIADQAELHEEQEIEIGQCAYGTVIMQAPVDHYNTLDKAISNTWTLNTNDLDFQVHFVQTQGTIASKKVGPKNATNNAVYTYLGCFREGTSKLLPRQIYTGNNNTNGNCQSLCIGGGYIFAGTEYQRECYCGNTPPPTSSSVDDAFCNFQCTGDGNDVCGGNINGAMISVYYDGTRYAPGANTTFGAGGLPIDQTVGPYSYLGCYTEGTGGKALAVGASAPPANGTTVNNCMTRCSAYKYFGVEYANECYCANAITNNATLVDNNNPDTNGCSMFCKGNSSQYCGGSQRLNVYYNPSFGSTTIKTSTTTSSVSTVSTIAPISTTTKTSSIVTTSTTSTSSTVISSTSTSSTSISSTTSKSTSVSTSLSSASTSTASLTTSTATSTMTTTTTTTTTTSTTPTPTPTTTSTSMSTPTSISTTSAVTSSSTTILTTITSSSATTITTKLSSTSSSATPTPTGPQTPQTLAGGNWTYQGCYTELATGRALGDLVQPIPGNNVSLDACAKACTGYTYFGTEYASECYCGWYLRGNSAPASGGSDPAKNGCSMTCKANALQYCGGAARLTLYKSDAVGPITNVTTLGNWTYRGCYNDSTAVRSLSYRQNAVASANTSVDTCAKACQGYTYFGVEYGTECYCGNSIGGNATNQTGVNPSETGCSTVCKGNSSQYCGGASRMNLYQAKPVAVKREWFGMGGDFVF